MTPLTAFALIPVIACSLVLAGYGLASRFRDVSPPERLALASLLGLGSLLWTWSVLNFFVPLGHLAAWLGLAQLAFPFLHRRTRTALRADLLAIVRHRWFVCAAGFGAAFLVFSFWPRISRPELLYYDGTSNHDGYLWIAGGKLLQQETYLTPGRHDSAHPWANFSGANRGWNPLWGRCGGETLLAATASATGVDPVNIYLSVMAALFLPWVASVYLVVRTFYTDMLSVGAVIALVALQPFFLFFQANGNLPNLLGVFAGALVVVATERTLRSVADRWAWMIALAVGLHTLLFSYPEIAPFVALPAALLVVRAAFSTRLKPAGVVLLGVLLGSALNPASTYRGIVGFFHSFDSARVDKVWANIFDPLGLPQYLLSFVTLSVPAGRFYGPIWGMGASLLLLLAAVTVLVRARDRFGALASLSGGAALLCYTVATDFNYGPQKSAQFAAIFISAVLPVAALQPLSFPLVKRLGISALTCAVAGIFVSVLYFHGLEIRKWARRKPITSDWTALASYGHQSLVGRSVLVEPKTFDRSFFYGMWPAYFLPESSLVYAVRGVDNGGYLNDSVVHESSVNLVSSDAVLVSRAWADAFDANSPRLFSSDDLVLLKTANRVTRLQGFQPAEKIPQTAAAQSSIEIRPHSRCRLQFQLSPLPGQAIDSTAVVRVTTGDHLIFSTKLNGPSPWHVDVPLESERLQRITLSADRAPSADEKPVFAVDGIRMISTP